MILSGVDLELSKLASKNFNLINSKGISVIFLVIAMLLMVTIGYVFSYLIPTKQKSVVFPIYSNQAFFIAQSGAEFAVRYAKNQGWTTTTLLNNLNGITRNLGSGRFTLTYNYATYGDKLISVGEVPIGTERRRIVVSNFTSFLYYFAYRKSITVNAAQVSGGPLTNFPMLVNIASDNNLRTIANGGNVASYNAGTNDPWDIIFEALDDATCGGIGTAPCKLNHEIETYVASTGQLVAWVRVPSINNGTVIYMYYGNSCMPSSTQNASGVWDANYKGVWHLSQNPTGTAPQMRDSTANAYNGTAVGSFVAGDQQAAVIDGGLNFNGTNDEIQISAAALGATSVTVSAWIRVKSFSETTFSATPGNLGAVVFSTRNVDGDVSPTLVVSPASGGAGTHNGLVFNNDSAGIAMGAKGSPPAISLNTWYYAVGTFSRSGAGNFAGNWNVYLNGALNGGPNNFNFAGTATGNFTGATWRLGNNAQWPNFSNVILDEVRVSNTVRSAGWIRTEYNNQNAPASFYSVGLEQN
jgi:hypothetical protein